ncbi:MAG: 2-hydroxyacid dehydrogenase [Actinomycetota bacterium]|nr:2-hydroxyacid dehydrogenase [Actinomycetota bacterium]
MKVVCGYDPGELYERLFAGWASSGAQVVVSPEEDAARLAGDLRDAEVLLHILTPVTDEVLAGAPRLRLVQKIGVGVNTIDLEAARRRGVAVANMPGTNTQAVAEAALMLMLAALRNLPGFDRACRLGKGWAPEGEVHERRNTLGELCGRTVGLVGAGAVASRLVGPLRALGARVIYTARSERPDLGIQRYSLDDLLEVSDIVSLHLPLTPETEGIIDRAALARMKSGAVLTNTARGGLVEEAPLVEALTSGHLRAAGLDVLSEEPPPPDHPLLALQNVVVTPHVAWLTQETLARSFDVALENILRLRDGRELLFRVA